MGKDFLLNIYCETCSSEYEDIVFLELHLVEHYL